MRDDLFRFVRELQLPPGDFAIFGSGPLIVRNIIPFRNDLDIICRDAAWELVQQTGQRQYLQDYDAHIVSMQDGAITFGTSWGIGQFDIDTLINSADILEDLPFVGLQYVIEYKKIRGLPKDLLHIEAASTAGYP
jgi:hypothetical protein